MNNKKLPPPPTLPPSFAISDNFCLFHKDSYRMKSTIVLNVKPNTA